MKIDLRCRECSGNHFRIDTAQHDEAIITCQECGHQVGTLAEVKQQVIAQIEASATSAEGRPTISKTHSPVGAKRLRRVDRMRSAQSYGSDLK